MMDDMDRRNIISLTESDVRNMILKVLNEIKASHLSHNNFDAFNFDFYGTGESNAETGKMAPHGHGFGTYLAIDPHSNPRYFKQSIRRDHQVDGKSVSIYYDCEIPDVTSQNYFFEKYPISEIPMIDDMIAELKREGIDITQVPGFSKNLATIDFYNDVADALQKAGKTEYATNNIRPSYASGFFRQKFGIIGMIYYGSKDRLAVCVFDNKDIKITNKTELHKELGFDITPVPSGKNDGRDKVKDLYKNSVWHTNRVKDFGNQNHSFYDANKYVNTRRELEKKGKA